MSDQAGSWIAIAGRVLLRSGEEHSQTDRIIMNQETDRLICKLDLEHSSPLEISAKMERVRVLSLSFRRISGLRRVLSCA